MDLCYGFIETRVLEKKKSDPITVYPFYGTQITFGQYPCARGVTFGDGAL